ncbi:MAG TPA: hypothetical protein V6C71_25090 [Coleofasciculaceae cyanobacterium]|jgi:pimeloyl-ACP methyl ester carboxylesterase
MVSDKVESLPLRILIVEDDPIMRVGLKQFKSVRPDAKYILYDIGAHAPHWENAEHFNHELANFLKAIA